ncbi:MAG: hypothetical protein HN913_03345 [Candidatus Marinimicrobia bacterium]|nr:hypothetical protein [Candidatus Neomarinimicrobiota bacterium]MBT5405485.1 hypothetical protein [Candidatus Neomarinimicrobiota bacterium]MBT6158466.1 hypothetical protein [Candidatus Neomarinimicrobiota bacterium]MBT7184888.1 hypothetical protein [Candidatus Neomarinimicrobiota bacterium]
MKYPANIIRSIEDQEPIESISAQGLKIWPILRNVIFDRLEKREIERKKTGIKKVFSSLQNYFWQVKNRNKHFSALLFTDSLEEQRIDGKISDKIAHNILKELGDDILLVTNTLGEKHKQIQKYAHPHCLNTSYFTLPAKWAKKISPIENGQILKSINQTLNLDIDFQDTINLFFTYVHIFDAYLLKAKPNNIFINCSYSILHQALNYSAKKQDIQTIELQHGVISKMQSPYMPSKDISRKTYPDCFLSFGRDEKDRISPNFIPSKNIYPIGHFYLERMKNKIFDKKTENYFKSLYDKYEKIITISSQETIEKELFNFVKKASERLPHVGFIFVPRKDHTFSFKNKLPENIILNSKIDLYTNTRFSDFHSSVYSSFASEALFLETPNIMINIQGLSRAYFSDVFKNNALVKFVETPEEYANLIQNWMPNQSEFKERNDQLFEQNNFEAVQKFMKILS